MHWMTSELPWTLNGQKYSNEYLPSDLNIGPIHSKASRFQDTRLLKIGKKKKNTE